MFAKLFNKSSQQQAPHPQARVTQADLNPRVTVHYGVPSTASILALDRTQSLLAIGTMDGRVKVIGGDNIEALLTSPKPLPFKNLEFLQNQGFLASVSSENEIQVWDLEQRGIASSLHWECNITAFSVIYGTNYMYIGSEYAMVSVLKYDVEDRKITLLPYYITANFISEAAGMSLPDNLSVVGVLHQPSSKGNRLLIAYENGLIILWDASEDRVVLVKGSKDLKVKEKTVTSSPKDSTNELCDVTEEGKDVEKEISSLCWVSDDGSILSVGYVDGDIMLWDLSTAPSTKDQKSEHNNVAKLQLSSGDRRLPVIVLHWSADRLHYHPRGQLFVYGGDAIGSQEVLTILSLDWSSGIESLKCIRRTDLPLNGSFADMVLLPIAGAMESSGTILFLLTNQGQLNVYDKGCLSALMSQQKEKTDVPAVQYPVFIPTTEPYMTVAKLALVHRDEEYLSALSKVNVEDTSTTDATKWPLTGAVPSQLYDAENYLVERIYAAGYQDGSVRIWNATYPALSLICVLGPEVKGIRSTGASATVSALDFCPVSSGLAVGDEGGLVRLYKLIGDSYETRLHFVTKTEKEVSDLQEGKGPQCMAVFSILASPICILQFANSGGRLAVGFECGQVAMLDISTLSVLFLTDSVSKSSSPVICLAVKSFSDTSSSLQSPEDSESKNLGDPGNGFTFIMTRNAHIVVLESASGNMISSWPVHLERESNAISMHIIEDSDIICDVTTAKHSFSISQMSKAKNDHAQTHADSASTQLEVEPDTSSKTAYYAQRLMNVSVLLCCENTLQLCSLKSVLEGDSNSIQKAVDLVKQCCWTTVLKKDGKHGGLAAFYQTGVIEIRSLPNLEVVRELSLMSILRWNFKTDMDKTICSSDQGQIILVNGCELAFLSLLSHENDFRIPESLPCLHDKVIAAATDVIASLSLSQKQVAAHGILGGIIKGLKAGKMEQNMDPPVNHENYCQTLESLFSSPPFLKSSTAMKDDQEIQELHIDDVVIVEPAAISSSSQKNKNEKKDKGTEKERLIEGATSDTKPRLRTAEEIKAKYRDTGDVSAAAARAREKLAERQEKLEKLRDNSEELQSGAEDFASMAKELAKRMENRKWWQI